MLNWVPSHQFGIIFEIIFEFKSSQFWIICCQINAGFRSFQQSSLHQQLTLHVKTCIVSNTSFHRLAPGSVRGGASRARLAIYKACWGALANLPVPVLMEAVDFAINNGFHILSMSLTLPYELPGVLHAVARRN